MYTEPIPHVVSKEVPPLSEAPEFLKTIAAPAVVDSSVASGTDRGVSESVAEVPAPAAPSADPYEHIRDFFTVAADEPEWYKDLRDNMMEMFRDTFTDNEGEAVAVPDIKQPRIGYGPLGDQQFPEACSACETALGPQGEPIFRFNENHDEKGQFTSGSSMTAAGDTGRWDVSGDHAEFGETNKSRLEDGYTIVKVPSDKVHVDTVYPDRVKQYAEQMGKGDKFPMPTGKTDDGGKTFWVANGNHRVAAAKSLGDEHIYLVVKNRELAGKRTAPMYGPQGEPVFRFNENHDEKGQFGSGGAVKLQHQAFEKDGDTKVEGDVKTTKYTAPNHSITVEHNTKENKITIKHLDKEGNLLVQQTHDSVGAARKELQTQGIDHKFYAA